MLQDRGRLEEALDCYRQAVALDAEFPVALFNMAVVLQSLGRLDEALASLRRVDALQPDHPEVLFNLGNLLRDQGKAAEALACYRRALELQPAFAGAWYNLGCLHQAGGRLDEALESYARALELQPDHAKALSNQGLAYKLRGDPARALAALRRALELRPDQADDLNNMGGLLLADEKLPEAVGCFRRALELQPDFAEAANNLCAALQMQGELEEALAWGRRALATRPDYAEALYNIGNALQAQGKFDEAIGLYDRAQRAKPGFGDPLRARALTLLAQGDFARGWPEHETRYTERLSAAAVPMPEFAFPMWRGEPLAGKRLLLVREQGFGDQIQFLRYAALFAAQGAAVDVMADARVARLFRTSPGVRQVVPDLARDSTDYDYWCLMLSAPLRAGTLLETVPAQVPYLHAPEDEVRKWQQRLAALPAKHLKVGLVWAGKPGYALDRFRNLPFQTLAPLAAVRGVSYISLQTGERENETRDASAGFPALKLGAEMGDFADAAALIMNLDLLIGVDTAFVHLAGALGRPVWLLQSAIPDWRWMRGRDDSPWYPTLRLMRQSRLGEWGPVIESAARELQKLART